MDTTKESRVCDVCLDRLQRAKHAKMVTMAKLIKSRGQRNTGDFQLTKSVLSEIQKGVAPDD